MPSEPSDDSTINVCLEKLISKCGKTHIIVESRVRVEGCSLSNSFFLHCVFFFLRNFGKKLKGALLVAQW